MPDDLFGVGLAEDVPGKDAGNFVFTFAAPWISILVDTDADVLVAA